MSNSLNTYTEKQLVEAKQNLIEQIKRIDAEMASRRTTSGGKKSVSAKSKSKSDSDESESDESESEKKPKKVRAPKKEASKKDDDDDAKEKPIKATIASMKEVLTYHEIDFPSKASKDELCDIVRKNRLVRECEKKESNKKSAKWNRIILYFDLFKYKIENTL